ncbi:uncharacterized protein [Montipora capricornis]|uniref:uncharacterized protein n=1 Tax=Montipora capricornis TaxID=246305 RepID=UPI0035F10725
MSVESHRTFFPNSCNQFGTLSDMETPHLATYNNSYKINEEGFTVESFKKTTGMTLPRLYLETKAKEQTNSRPQWKSPSCDTSYTTEVNNVGSSSPSEGDSGLQDRSCDTDQVSSDLDSMQLMSLFGNPNLSLLLYEMGKIIYGSSLPIDCSWCLGKRKVVTCIVRIWVSTSGQIVFNSYKDRTPLPEDVARANGHDDLANYLQDFTTRFSKEPECSLKEAHVIDWSELEAAVTAAQTQWCLSEEKSCDDSSENNSDTDYFADVETSSIELSRTSSEDNTSKLYSRTLLYGAMVKIGQIREGVKQKSYVLILRDSHFDSTLPEVVKGLDYTLAFHLAVGSKNIPRHLHTANERFLASRERMIRQPTISFYIFAELRSQLSIENTIPGEWKSSDISVKQFGAHTNFDLWVFTSAFRPTRKTLFVYFADRRDALPHNYFFEDEDCESHICCWKWKKSGNNSLKFTERLKGENQPPGQGSENI